jgi:hypothetical protein
MLSLDLFHVLNHKTLHSGRRPSYHIDFTVDVVDSESQPLTPQDAQKALSEKDFKTDNWQQQMEHVCVREVVDFHGMMA